ncbi:MAG: hypothetical protein ABIN89_21005 [Chitinophagaceae bacterium]
METQEIEDVQALINIFFPFAEELIVKFGEFFPFAGATTTEAEFVSVGLHEENKHLAPNQVVSNLKSSLKQQHEKYIVTAVFYEVKSKDMDSGESEDAIAVFVEHKNGLSAYEFFYPYKVEAEDNFIVGDSYGNAIPKEIF